MSSITFAMSGEDHSVPGIDCALGAVLFVMHVPAVRAWILERRTAAGGQGLIVIADDDWASPGGGYQSLTVPASAADLSALAAIRAKAAAAGGGAGRSVHEQAREDVREDVRKMWQAAFGRDSS